MTTAIQTRYAGYHFRSRLEARWAVFFDTLGVRWLYEDEGYELEWVDDEVWRYLPDFVLPDLGVYVEVKGSTATLPPNYLMILGNVGHMLPGVHNSWYGRGAEVVPDARGLLLLGDIPRVHEQRIYHRMLSHYKGCASLVATWTTAPPGAAAHLDAHEDPLMFPGGWSSASFDECELESAAEAPDLWRHLTSRGRISLKVAAAYEAARSARFEHGHRGAS